MRRSLRIAGRQPLNTTLTVKKTQVKSVAKSKASKLALKRTKESRRGAPEEKIVDVLVKQECLSQDKTVDGQHAVGTLLSATCQPPASSYPCKITTQRSQPPPSKTGLPARTVFSKQLESQAGIFPFQMRNRKEGPLQGTSLPQQAGFPRQGPLPPQFCFPLPAGAPEIYWPQQAGTRQAGLSTQSLTEQEQFACACQASLPPAAQTRSSMQHPRSVPAATAWPLGWHLTQTLKEKIWNGDYVDLFSLPEFRPQESVFEDSREQQWLNWLRGYITYLGVVLEQDPSKTPALLKYLDLIIHAYQHKFRREWLDYDEYFRKNVGKNAHHSWGKMHFELWSWMVLATVPGERSDSGHLIVRYTDDRAQNVLADERDQFRHVCYMYNRTGRCTKESCRYSHVCALCGAKHAVRFCPKLRRGKKRKFNL